MYRYMIVRSDEGAPEQLGEPTSSSDAQTKREKVGDDT
jgi:hypothetical protein